jgi:hypothetical protein
MRCGAEARRSEGVGPVKRLSDGFFLLFFICARSSSECQRKAHLNARLELDQFV